jgi:hypothetical protein
MRSPALLLLISTLFLLTTKTNTADPLVHSSPILPDVDEDPDMDYERYAIDPEQFYAYMEQIIAKEKQLLGLTDRGPLGRPAGSVEPALLEVQETESSNPSQCRLLVNTWLGKCVFSKEAEESSSKA